MSDFIFAGLFLLASLTAFLLITALSRSKPSVRRGLESLSRKTTESRPSEPSPLSYREAMGLMGQSLRRFDVYRAMERYLVQAGWLLKPMEYAVVTVIGVGLVGAGWWYATRDMRAAGVAAACAFAAAAVAPRVAMWIRVQRFEHYLPGALDLMAASLRAGHGFQTALQVTATDMPRPISDEFGAAVTDIGVGHSVEEALLGILARVPSYEMELIATAVTIQLQVGGNLSEVLRKISFTIRERARIRGEISTLTAEGRLSAVIIFVLPILLFIWLCRVSPAYMAPLTQEEFGRLLLIAAAVLQIVGMILIWRIVSLEV